MESKPPARGGNSVGSISSIIGSVRLLLPPAASLSRVLPPAVPPPSRLLQRLLSPAPSPQAPDMGVEERQESGPKSLSADATPSATLALSNHLVTGAVVGAGP
jgi:hypothetical protein